MAGKPVHLIRRFCYHVSMSSRSNIAVSACLLGEPCRYDGASVPCAAVIELAKTHGLVSVCPEQLGGLPTPRTSSEIQPNGRVVDRAGVDRTEAFKLGAREALKIARENGCALAVLKSRSPSCGVHQVYDGTFTGTIVPGEGVTAAEFRQAGLQLLDEIDVSNGLQV